jgi:peptidoglycan/LPS O-acetylase OafA/YrhL
MKMIGSSGRPNDAEPRIRWLDGLRGVAALQVLLLHYATAFLPGLGLPDPSLSHYRWEPIVADTPLYVVLNGNVSVDLFFLLSGTALSLSFARHPFAFARSALRRVIRLGIPMAAATLLAALLFSLWPDAHRTASRLTGSVTWLGSLAPTGVTVPLVLHQITLEGMLAGFRDTSLLPGWVADGLGLGLRQDALNAPLWTLHIEFAGSLIVLVLVMLRAAAPRWLHGVVCAGLLAAFATTPLLLFVIGHLAAPIIVRGVAGRWRWIGAACLAGGITLASGQCFDWVGSVLTVLPQPPTGPATGPLPLQFMISALGIFLGITLLSPVQRWLTLALPRWLGRLSFSLYLVHFPVLFTVISVLFLHLQPVMDYGAAIVLCMGAGAGVSLGLAALFARWVDGPAIRLSRAVFPHRAPASLRPESGLAPLLDEG